MSQSDAMIGQIPFPQRVRELELIVQVSRTLTSTLDLDRLLTLIVKTASELIGSLSASIILEDPRTGELAFEAATGPKSEELKSVKVPMVGSIAGTVYKTHEPLIVQDTGADPRHYAGVDSEIEYQTQSLLTVPMMYKERAIGVLQAVNKLDYGRFDDHDAQILSTLAAQAAVAIVNARLVTELQAAYTQLEELDRLKSDFIAIASHELRTPLGLILGYASFLRDEADGAASEQLDVVLNAAMQLRGLIEDMVNLSHLEAGSAELDLSEASLQEVIQESIEAQRQFAASKSIEIITSFPSTPMRVRIDREKIVVVINNLLNNAIKFSSDNSRVQVAVRPQTGMVAVSVTDAGIGIPEHELNRVFEQFYQVESHLTRYEGGMGIGLTIARGMVELHGGRIWAESVEGKGSRFTFTLPILWKDVAPEGT
jgi:signal transduction histidine kinase